MATHPLSNSRRTLAISACSQITGTPAAYMIYDELIEALEDNFKAACFEFSEYDVLKGFIPHLEAEIPDMKTQGLEKYLEGHAYEMIETLRSRISLIALDHTTPLMGTHSRCPAVGQQIDEHVIRMDIEQIVSGVLEDSFSFHATRKAQWFHGFDFEWFDDGLHKFHPCNDIAFLSKSLITIRFIIVVICQCQIDESLKIQNINLIFLKKI